MSKVYAYFRKDPKVEPLSRARKFLLAPAVMVLFMALLFLSCSADSMEVDAYGENTDIFDMGTANNGGLEGSDGLINESITEILRDEGHTELIEALDYVNAEIYTQLVELFASQQRKHTVFAPSNEAFYAFYDCLGMKTQDISELGDPGLVRDILLYHVLRGVNETNTIIPVENENKVETLYGKALTVKSDRTIQSVGSVAVIDPEDSDKKARNGVVHVVSEVLLPVELTCRQD